jgi:hypothetical protein
MDANRRLFEAHRGVGQGRQAVGCGRPRRPWDSYALLERRLVRWLGPSGEPCLPGASKAARSASFSARRPISSRAVIALPARTRRRRGAPQPRLLCTAAGRAGACRSGRSGRRGRPPAAGASPGLHAGGPRSHRRTPRLGRLVVRSGRAAHEVRCLRGWREEPVLAISTERLAGKLEEKLARGVLENRTELNEIGDEATQPRVRR